ncbi:mCG140960, partial [Mus musculus]
GANGCWLSRCRCSDGQGGTLAFGTICTLTKVCRAWSRSLWRLRAGFVGSSGSVALQSPQEASTLTMVSHCSVACSTGNQQHTCRVFILSQQFRFFKTECIISCFSIKKFLYLWCQFGFRFEAHSRVIQNQQLEAVWTCFLKSAVILVCRTVGP